MLFYINDDWMCLIVGILDAVSVPNLTNNYALVIF